MNASLWSKYGGGADNTGDHKGSTAMDQAYEMGKNV